MKNTVLAHVAKNSFLLGVAFVVFSAFLLASLVFSVPYMDPNVSTAILPYTLAGSAVFIISGILGVLWEGK